MRRLVVSPAPGPLTGRNRPPGDKSVSQRAAILGGLARGKTVIRGFLDSDDAASTLSAMEQLGARVERGGAGRVDIHGGALRAPDKPLDLGNSGTGLRSEEHTSELQSRGHLVCRLLLAKKKA